MQSVQDLCRVIERRRSGNDTSKLGLSGCVAKKIQQENRAEKKDEYYNRKKVSEVKILCDRLNLIPASSKEARDGQAASTIDHIRRGWLNQFVNCPKTFRCRESRLYDNIHGANEMAVVAADKIQSCDTKN